MNADGLAGPTPSQLGFLSIMIGVLLALDTFLNLAIVYKLWPVLIGMVGVGLIASQNMRGFT